MIYFIFQRLKMVWLNMLAVVCSAHIMHLFFHHLDGVALCTVFFCMFLGAHSNWIQILPYSRKKILAWHGLYSFILTMSAVFFATLIVIPFNMISIDKALAENFPMTVIWGILVLAAGILRFSVPMKNEMKRNYSNISGINFRRWMVILFLGIPLLYFFGKQPLAWVAIVLGVLVWLPTTAYAAIFPPLESFRRGRRWTTIAFISLLTATGTYWLSEVLLLPVSVRTEMALDLMGDLRISISKARALELIESPSIGSSNFAVFLENRFGSEVSVAKLKAKIENCRSRGCFNLGTIISRHFDESQRLEIFASMLNRCSLKLSASGYVYCERELHRQDIREWFSLLATSNELDKWLRSEEFYKRFAAMRVLEVSGANPTQLKEIERISSEFKDVSAFEAGRLISYHQDKALKNQAKCQVDKTDSACDSLVNFWLSNEDSKSILEDGGMSGGPARGSRPL